MKLGRIKEAQSVEDRFLKVLRRQLGLVPEDVRARILLATSLARAGEDHESIRHLQTAIALRPGDANVLYNAACAYGVLGKKAEALETLKKALSAGYGNRTWAAKDSDLESLHGDPESEKLVGSSPAQG
jgi:Flp pilus assembly protein TadD